MSTTTEYEQRFEQAYARLEKQLRPQLTPGFLKTLVEAAVLLATDTVETYSFVRECFYVAEVALPADLAHRISKGVDAYVDDD